MSSPETTMDRADASAGAHRPGAPAPVRQRYGRRTWVLALAGGTAAGVMSTWAGTHLAGWTAPVAVSATAMAAQVLVGVPAAMTDLREHRIPNPAVAAVAAWTLAALAMHPALLSGALMAAAAVAALMVVLNLLAGVGMGDAKLAAACALAWGIHGPGLTMLALAAGFAAAFPPRCSPCAPGIVASPWAHGSWLDPCWPWHGH